MEFVAGILWGGIGFLGFCLFPLPSLFPVMDKDALGESVGSSEVWVSFSASSGGFFFLAQQ